MGDTRIIQVEADFYIKLAEYLQPEERFSPPINVDKPFGYILYVPFIQRELIFTLDKDKKNE